MHSFDVVDDVQHIVVVQQVSLSLKVAVVVAAAAAVAFVVVIHVVDSSPVVVVVFRMDELNLYVLLVKQTKTVQLDDVVPLLLLIVEDFELMTKHCSAS